MMPQMFDYSLKDCYFHEVDTILALMNVLAYVKCFNGHINIETSFYFSTIITHSFYRTKLLTQMEIYVSPGNEG